MTWKTLTVVSWAAPLDQEQWCPCASSLHHANLSVVTRAFDLNGTISGLHDWVSSLSPELGHFCLMAFHFGLTLDKKEEQTAGWLVWYFRTADTKTLCHYVHFCTGKTMLPIRQLSIRFDHKSEAAMKPKASVYSLSLPYFQQLLQSIVTHSFSYSSSNLITYSKLQNPVNTSVITF